jgi:CMP-N,N'-diacetyllegionaminic acid synthase
MFIPNSKMSTSTTKGEALALIPARGGSKRIPGKNIRLFAGHPLIAYSISAARESGIFSRIVVSTDDEAIAATAKKYGADVPFLRPKEFAGDLSPDIEWVRQALEALRSTGASISVFSILRPTSPFRTAATIRRAWKEFSEDSKADSLRAVEKCREHPGKMWVVENAARILPLLPQPSGQPWHSTPYQSLPEIYVQNASLEMAHARVVFDHGTIAGEIIRPFFTQDLEGFDLNRPEDWIVAEAHLTQRGASILPTVSR